jgi:hypothetical protein
VIIPSRRAIAYLSRLELEFLNLKMNSSTKATSQDKDKTTTTSTKPNSEQNKKSKCGWSIVAGLVSELTRMSGRDFEKYREPTNQRKRLQMTGNEG